MSSSPRRELHKRRPKPDEKKPSSARVVEEEGSEEKQFGQVKIILQRLVEHSRDDALEALEYLCLSFTNRPELGDLLLEIRFLMTDIARSTDYTTLTQSTMKKVMLWAQNLRL